MTDEKLVRDFLKTRSESSFSRLYEAHTPWLYQMALKLVNYNQSDAEELVQEVWIAAIRSLESFEWRSLLRTWLYRILFNKYSTYASRVLHVRQEPDIGHTHQPEYLNLDLEKAIQCLSQGYKEVLLLHDVEGYKHREIAEILGISEGTSKSQLSNARKRLRELLKN